MFAEHLTDYQLLKEILHHENSFISRLRISCYEQVWARIAHSVQRLATGWKVRDRNLVGARFTSPAQTGPEADPASCKMGTESFSRRRGKAAWAWY